MTCSNCGKKLERTDPKKRICIHGICCDGGGLWIGGKDFIVNPDFCSKECASEYFSNALDVITEKCNSCADLYSTGVLF